MVRNNIAKIRIIFSQTVYLANYKKYTLELFKLIEHIRCIPIRRKVHYLSDSDPIFFFITISYFKVLFLIYFFRVFQAKLFY